MEKSTSKLFQTELDTVTEEDAVSVSDAKTIPEDAVDMSKVNDNVPEKNEVVRFPVPEDDSIQDVTINAVKRKRFRINGNNDAILELDTSDLSISYRLQDAYSKLNDTMREVANALQDIPEDGELSDNDQKNVADTLKKLDNDMRELIDYIFDAPVSAICLPKGSMYSPHGGMYTYEHIIDAITQLYETNLNKEFALMRQRVANKTAKYTKPGKSPTKKYARH